MIVKAEKIDQLKIIEILTQAFESNASVNYLVRQDSRRLERIRKLMHYSVRVCTAYGKVVLFDDRNAAALVMLEKKGFNLCALLWDLQLVFGVSGISNLRKILRREVLIKQQHPSAPFYYLWFIGVDPAHKGYGIGSDLLRELIADADAMNRPIYLETSTLKNISWYQKFGFEVFHEIDIGYKLFFLRR